jgi:hypothetical protein
MGVIVLAAGVSLCLVLLVLTSPGITPHDSREDRRD